MFKNIPERMQKTLEGLPEQFRKGEHRYVLAAHLVILEYLGKNIPTSDAFLGYQVDERDVINPAYLSKVELIGKELFMLRSCSTFDEVCRRMQERDLREVYYEILAVSQFLKAEFDIDVKKEIGVKGEDFDFVASRKGETVNVEVTAFTKDEFSEKTVENALNYKRKQVPNSEPAVIFCVTPPTWWESLQNELPDKMSKIVAQFFNGSKRINYIVLFYEIQISGSSYGLGGLMYARSVFPHPSPRLSLNVERLFPKEAPTFAAARMAANDGHDILTFSDKVRSGEFYEWVDDALSRDRGE